MSIRVCVIKLIAQRRLRSAARRYARQLGPQLQRDYGAAAHYTLPQIRAATQKCGLPVAFIAIGYAAFLSEDAFQTTAAETFELDYKALRALFSRYVTSTAPVFASADSDWSANPNIGGGPPD